MSSEVQAATDGVGSPAAPADPKRRRRGRRGGRNRHKGAATAAEPAAASAPSRREPSRGSSRTSHAPTRRSSAPPVDMLIDEPTSPSLATRRPVPPLPVDAPPDFSGPSVKGRYGDPGLSSRISLLEMQFRRLLTCEKPAKLDDGVGAPDRSRRVPALGLRPSPATTTSRLARPFASPSEIFCAAVPRGAVRNPSSRSSPNISAFPKRASPNILLTTA